MRTIALRRGLAALLVAALSYGVQADEKSANTLRIGYQKYGTLVLLKARGTLEKRLAEDGVKVQWTEFPGGPQLLEGLNVGSIDFGVTGETPPVFAQAAGADHRGLAEGKVLAHGLVLVVASAGGTVDETWGSPTAQKATTTLGEGRTIFEI